MKAAVFDFDGTLVDSMEFWNNLAKNYLFSIGVMATDDLNKAIEKLTVDEGIAYMKERYKIPKSVIEIKEEMDILLVNYYRDDVKLKPNVIEMLERLKDKGIRIAIASLTDENLIRSVLKRYDIEHYFEFIQTCENTRLSKDDKSFFQFVSENLNLEGKEIFIFEDSLYAMIASKEAGLKVIGVEDSSAIENLEKILDIVDYYIKDFNEFILDEKYLGGK